MTSQGYFKELNIKQRKFHKKELRDSKQLEKVFKIADEISHGMESLQKDIIPSRLNLMSLFFSFLFLGHKLAHGLSGCEVCSVNLPVTGPSSEYTSNR